MTRAREVFMCAYGFTILPAQATLSMDAKPGQKVGLLCKVAEDDEGTLLCALREGGTESQSLNLIFGARASL
jgi:hypothetical protein